MDEGAFEEIVMDNEVDQIIHLTEIQPQEAEENPSLTFDINIKGSLIALNVAKNFGCSIFIPSSEPNQDHRLYDISRS